MKDGILRNLRLSRQISQKDFAKTIGVSQQTVASWEIGRTEPSNDALRKLSEIFGVSTDYLLGNERSPQYIFSSEESQLVNDYRQLSDKSKKLIRSMIEQLNFGRASNGSIVNVGNSNFLVNGSNNRVSGAAM